MATQPRCQCQSCTIRSLTGPALVITVGVLFLLHQLRGGLFSFEHTFPAILIVLGAIQLASSMASRAGHREILPTPGIPPSVPPVPPTGVSQPPYTPQSQ